MYEREIRHDGLRKFRIIRGKSMYEIDQKAEMQLKIWEDQWNKVIKKQEELKQKTNRRAIAQLMSKKLKDERTVAEDYLQRVIKRARNENLKDNLTLKTFTMKEPSSPTLEEVRNAPDPSAQVYQPMYNFIEELLPFLAPGKKQEAQLRYNKEKNIWLAEKDEIDARNEKTLSEYREKYQKWSREKEAFEKAEQKRFNHVHKVFEDYKFYRDESIESYFDFILNHFILLDYIPIQRTTKYLKETKTLYIEQYLPTVKDMTNVKEVKYVVEGDDFLEVRLSEKYLNELYDRLLYSYLLSMIHLIFKYDERHDIESVAINGYVDSINTGTGKTETLCISSLFVSREEFLDINLEMVNPNVCFKQLKGIGSSKLYSLTAVAPVIKMDWNDNRIMEGKDTIHELEETTNLASMDWQDFEHLIREIFEKEFSKNGGEVRITQASRDGGVDAIAFDPDPLRGGKIVIQAKRYTNTVGVSAVRDLYGTVMNEGAIKGILVSTADYGPDAYNFVKDKPLTLLNGSNLLYLLENHGHKAIIDLHAAKNEKNRM
ncbi:restriction endonuclease [Exiguobacterium sp. s157]|uniref:restriction endonuclease n=1 Tax=Exiguobacterium sp. s157 TaxID=2751233 RepID=UPI001BECC6D4|nr:restriction endonuclease [Exiguobacterium sp. s157]